MQNVLSFYSVVTVVNASTAHRGIVLVWLDAINRFWPWVVRLTLCMHNASNIIIFFLNST